MSRIDLARAIDWLPLPTPSAALNQLTSLLERRREEALARGWDREAPSGRDSDLTRAKSIQQAIRGILLRHWNPIGISLAELPASEYDPYIGRLYRLIANGSGSQAIAAALAEAERAMGLEPNATALLPVADRLAILDVRLHPPEAV